MLPSRQRRGASPVPRSNRHCSRSGSRSRLDSRHRRRTSSRSPPPSHHRRRSRSRSPPSSHHRRRSLSRSLPSSHHRRRSLSRSLPSSHHRRRSRSRSRSPPSSHHRRRSRSNSPPSSSHHRCSPTLSPSSSCPPRREPVFRCHHDEPDLPPNVRLFCGILSSPSTPSHSLLSILDDTRTSVDHKDVENVLRLSYSHPGPALAFFRWAGERHLNHRHSPYSWNLVVDMLGKNLHFDTMWDYVLSMRDQNFLSLATFASIFSSLASDRRTGEAMAAFRALPKYGIRRDTVALNSLLAAVCRSGLLTDGRVILCDVVLVGVSPDQDSFAILLEGCKKEKDAKCAQKVFIDMIKTLG